MTGAELIKLASEWREKPDHELIQFVRNWRLVYGQFDSRLIGDPMIILPAIDAILLVVDERDELRERVAELERGEYICKRCLLRKEAENVSEGF